MGRTHRIYTADVSPGALAELPVCFGANDYTYSSEYRCERHGGKDVTK